MGIYSGDERIDSVNVGSKDMVVLMQDNHILALGKKYWAVDLGSLNWIASETQGIYYCALPTSKPNGKAYCKKYENITAEEVVDLNIGIAINSNRNILVYDPTYETSSAFKTAMNGVWLVYEFDTTSYDKIDLGSMSWQKIENYSYANFISETIKTLVEFNYSSPTISCFIYTPTSNQQASSGADNYIWVDNAGGIRIKDTGKTTLSGEQFGDKLKGKNILYKKVE